MSERRLKALLLIKQNIKVYPDQFARLMWPDSPSWHRYSNVGNGATVGVGIRQKAGSMLWAMEKDGLLCLVGSISVVNQFQLTAKGRDAIREDT